ncbi:MAG: hypothetical protein A2V66_01580 [Ignavibacteria bacterium RBG_13_36_8]|nr:MAG: hypothetical protein A2V66_01580 [Ignavibacteria bacterium RBG_13_36_8]
MNKTSVKYFTPEEARKTLPLVKQIVRDILNKGCQIRTIVDKLNGNIEINDELQYLIEEMEAYINELKEIGCYYKDWNFLIGLVDFPSIIDGKEVYLCWKSDEEDILYYHGINEGYAGRKIIPVKEKGDPNSK